MKERCKRPHVEGGRSHAFPLRVSFRRRVFVDEIIVTVRGFSRSDFLFRFSVRLLHFFDRHCHEGVYIFKLSTCNFRVHHRSRVGPGFTFWIKNARQSLAHAGLIIQDPAFGRTDVKRRLWPVNNATAIVFLTETSRGNEQKKNTNAKKWFHHEIRSSRAPRR